FENTELTIAHNVNMPSGATIVSAHSSTRLGSRPSPIGIAPATVVEARRHQNHAAKLAPSAIMRIACKPIRVTDRIRMPAPVRLPMRRNTTVLPRDETLIHATTKTGASHFA